MSTMTAAIITGYACDADACPEYVELDVPETLPDPRQRGLNDAKRWHAPAEMQFYGTGWAYMRGTDKALTYCPEHVSSTVRCDCPGGAGGSGPSSRSCPWHSQLADVRMSAEAAALLGKDGMLCAPTVMNAVVYRQAA